MKKTNSKKLFILFAVLWVAMALPLSTSAMHIMEGYLAPIWAISWGVLCLPFLAMGFISIKKKVAESQKTLLLLALCGAFAFVLSALKLPSVTGSCSHPTGVGLGAILFGPFAMSIISVIVLLFQAVLLAHGGITTLGANTFSMGIVGPVLSFICYKLGKKFGLSTGISVFFAAFIGNLFTYLTTSVQLALAYPDGGSIMASFIKFAGIFALTQIPLAISEGLLTVVVFGILEKYSSKELKTLAVI